MHTPKKHRYVFQADAIGVSGHITHPCCDIIPAQAASALSPDGGSASSRVEAFRHKEILSFSAAYTLVSGSEPHPGVFDVLALSVVENFNLLDVVRCDRIVGRLTSTYHANEKGPKGQPPENSIVPTGSYFEGLRIGNTVIPRLEVAPSYFCDPAHATWAGLCTAINKDRNILAPLSLPGPDGKPVPLPAAGKSTNMLGFCIALTENPAAVFGGPVRLSIPDFGTVHLGEFFCYPNSRRLIMLRAELGCNYGGSGSAGALSVPGGPYPPGT